MLSSDQRLVVLAGAGGTLAIAAIAGAVFGLRAIFGDSSPAAVGPPSTAAQVARAGMEAPGAAELRRLGCDTAVVLDLSTLMGDAGAIRDGEPRYIVTCDVARGEAPTCQRVADAYFGAIGGPAKGNVNVRVARPGSPEALCSRLYAPSGSERVP